jgi:folate-dependent phosphoribosylglycinamide formyltransferase PurN
LEAEMGSSGKIARAVLICHDSEPLNRYGLARWMASFLELAAIIEIHEPPGRLRKRIWREMRRVGAWRFLDVLAFRLYSRLMLGGRDREFEERLLREVEARYAEIPAETKILRTPSPNSAEAEALVREVRPEIIVARCKSILSARIFKQAEKGTLVMHPGICPQYRNAHGCFWALARRDMENVGMTLLKIDEGVDTGPVYGYFRASFDEGAETHNMIQSNVVFENLDALRAKFEEIAAGTAKTIDTRGFPSRAWGQPWLTSYLGWKRVARAAIRAAQPGR